MSVQILATKLYIPPSGPKIVLRLRLIERLNECLQHKLTLISAPAGFGKTTLVSEWVQAMGGATPPIAVAWLSLDEGDDDPTRFLTYLVAALQTISANLGAGTLDALQSPMPPSTESILTSLINEITSFKDKIILVLDDYHVIGAKPVDASTSVDDAITYLIDHQPPQMHLVITTREDPPLPLARLRGRGQLAELRAADLRFTLSEAVEFLNQVMGLTLSEEDIAALETRTEGWIAGLQLAAISMKGQQDTSGFIQSFTGSHRFVMDYLVEEVLKQQPENVQNFLLFTSILDRLCSPLCDAVMPGPPASGQETLEYLERNNLFIVPLDNERRWYRYHQLFAELLRNRLYRTHPDQIGNLHRRASDWYALNDFPNEAIVHALAIQDWSRAADIIEQFSDQWPMRGEINTLIGWHESFPAEVRLERIKLGWSYAWALYMANQLDRAEQLINQLMPHAQSSPSLVGELFTIRVMIAAQRYDMPAVIELARQALSLVPPEEASPRSRILLSLGVAYYDLGGDIANARTAFREAFELGQAIAPGSNVGNAPLPLIALAYLAEIELLQGHLRDAYRMYERALELAEQWGRQPSIALSLVQWGRARLFYEWNNLDEAVSALEESVRIGEMWKNQRLLVQAYGISALVLLARGQAEGARAMIRRAEKITRDAYSTPTDMGWLAINQIVLWIAQNDFHAIAQWELDHDTGWRARIGRARDSLVIVLAQGKVVRYFQQHDSSALSQARALIQPGLEQAQASGMTYNVARFLILDALALYAQGETASATLTLKHALALAEPENYIRSFLDIGKPMEDFLSWSLESPALSEPLLRAHVGRLLSHYGGDLQSRSDQPTGGTLIEPLSQRELEVLRLVARGLSNREISEQLFLALSTVKGYNRIIFDKLQVQRRTEAIVRARELGLL